MHLEKFAEGNSLFHTFDPRAKIIVFLLVAFSSTFLYNLKIIFLYFIIITFLVLINLPHRLVIKRLFFTNFFILFLVFSLIIGDLLKSYYLTKRLVFSTHSLYFSLLIFLKSNVIYMSMLLFLATSSLSQLTHALFHFRLPNKFVSLFFLSYRFLTVLHLEYDKMRKGLLSKGFKNSTSLFTYKTYAFLISVLLIKSLKKANELYQAMLARGYKGFYPLFEHFTFKKRDYIFLILTIVLILAGWIWILSYERSFN